MTITAPEGYVPMFIPLSREAEVHALLAGKSADDASDSDPSGPVAWSAADFVKMREAQTLAMQTVTLMIDRLALDATADEPKGWVSSDEIAAALGISKGRMNASLAHFTMWIRREFAGEDRNWPISAAWGTSLGLPVALTHYRMSAETAKLWIDSH